MYNYDLNNVSLENLPNIVEHELAQLVSLENHLTTLENYHVRMQDGNLGGRELDDCYNLCSRYNTEVSVESLNVSNEGLILGAILVAIIAVVAMIFGVISKAYGAIKRMIDEGITPEQADYLAKELNITEMDADGLHKIADAVKQARAIVSMRVDKITPEDIAKTEVIDSENGKELLRFIKGYKAFILSLGGNITDKDTVDAAVSWGDDLLRMGLFKTAGKFARERGGKAPIEYKALTVLSYNLKEAAANFEKTAETITASHQGIIAATRNTNKTSYRDILSNFGSWGLRAQEAAAKAKPVINDKWNLDAENMMHTANLMSHGMNGRILKEMEGTIKELIKAKDPKASAKIYIEPIVKCLAALNPDAEQSLITAEAKNVARVVPHAAGQWMQHYARFVLAQDRFFRFLKKNKEILDILKANKQ